jgi:hypothetical protein
MSHPFFLALAFLSIVHKEDIPLCFHVLKAFINGRTPWSSSRRVYYCPSGSEI